jgi:hypothetical protein
VKCTGTENNFAGTQLLPANNGPRPDADGASSLELHAIHQCVAANREIGALARRFQIAIVRGHAGSSTAVHRPRRDPGTVWGIVVLGPPIAQLKCSGAEGTIHDAPLVKRGAIDWDRATATVIRSITKIDITF